MGKILFGIVAAVASIMLGKIKQIDYCFDKKKTKKKQKTKKLANFLAVVDLNKIFQND